MPLHRRTCGTGSTRLNGCTLAACVALVAGCAGDTGERAGDAELQREEHFAQVADSGTRLDAGSSDPDSGTSRPDGLWIPDADEELPERFSAFGLYPRAPALESMAPGANVYEPRFPLWSNGSAKYRVVALPTSWRSSEKSAPTADPEDMPEGITFFKTFTFADEDSASGYLPKETRVIRLGVDGWEYHRYTWNDDGSDATLNTSRVQQYVEVEFEGESFEHEIPNETDCKRCHEAAKHPILGYTELQLSDAPLDAAPDELTEQVMGYVVGNCNHCHNGGTSDANSFDMSPDVFLDAVVDRMTEGSGSGIGVRVVPGDPQSSILFIALAGGDDDTEVQPMPPIGVQLRDQRGLSLFREWIEDLD